MKHLLIIFSLLLSSVSWSKDVTINDIVERDGLWYEKYSDKPFTGNCNGAYKGKIKNGKKEGKWLYFMVDGQLREKENYENGKKEGEYLMYYSNGKIRQKGNYKNNKLDGKVHWYNIDGSIKMIGIYKKGYLLEIIDY